VSPRQSPQGSITDELSGNRWYFEPDGNGGELRLMSVTTAFNSIRKMGLDKWMTLYTANAAFDELPTLITASRVKPCGRTNHKCGDRHDWLTCAEKGCGDCRACVALWLSTRHGEHSGRRSDEGRRAHDVIEWWSMHGEFRPYDNDIAPYVAAFKALVDDYGLTPESFIVCEATCVNVDDKYAGTTDGILRFEAAATEKATDLVARVLRHNGEYAHLKTPDAIRRAVRRDKRHIDVITDWKTREKESPEFYPNQALQVTGYRRCPVIRIKGAGHLTQMPATDGGVVIQLRPDGVTVRPVVTDDESYTAFLSALRLSIWLQELGGKATGVNSFPLGRKDVPPDTVNGAVVDTSSAPPNGTAHHDPFALVGAATNGRTNGGQLRPRDAKPGATLTDADLPF
jgi:hypothetical protein